VNVPAADQGAEAPEAKRTGDLGSEVVRGLRASLPLVLGNTAWGAAFGAAAVSVLPVGGATTMSAISFSGVAQAAALGMLTQPLAGVFLTSLLLSLRFIPMSIALLALLPGLTRWRRALVASCLADFSFALLAAGRVRSAAGLVGVWLGVYSAFVIGTAAGELAAPLLPASLRAASDGWIAVIFAVLLVEACTGRRQVGVAVCSAAGVGAAMLAVPGSLALPAAAILASAVGVVVRR
jgi:predicted branched-subunit amino acid permease